MNEQVITESASADKIKETWWRPGLSFVFSLISTNVALAACAVSSTGEQVDSSLITTSIVALLIATSIAITSLERQRKGTNLLKVGLGLAFLTLIIAA